MSNERKSPTNKTHFKKPKPAVNALDTYLKNQQKEKQRLKKDLETVMSQEKELHSLIVEKNKCIVGLQKTINESNAEILKHTNTNKQLEEQNVKILQDLSLCYDKLHELENHYDQISKLQKTEIDDLKAQLNDQKNCENQKLQELSLYSQNLQQQLQEKMQLCTRLNEKLLEMTLNFEKMKQDYKKQQIDFKNYKILAEEEKNACDETNNLKYAELNEIINLKEDIIKKYMEDKESLEKEKNLIIDELNNKIHRIERAFSQPTKGVQPIVSFPNNTTNDMQTSQNYTEIANDYVAVTRPQVCEPVEAQLNPVEVSVNTEIRKPPQRQYKFKTPSQHPTFIENPMAFSSNIGNNNNKKRRGQPAKSAIHSIVNKFSSSPTDDDSDDDSVDSIIHRQWRPKPRDDDFVVADTSDASECFAKPKRAKK